MPRDVPIAQCRSIVDHFLAVNPTTKAFQKFTCAGCGERLMMEEPNVFHETGHCDRCGYVTDLSKRGCGYMLTFGYRR